MCLKLYSNTSLFPGHAHLIWMTELAGYRLCKVLMLLQWPERGFQPPPESATAMHRRNTLWLAGITGRIHSGSLEDTALM